MTAISESDLSELFNSYRPNCATVVRRYDDDGADLWAGADASPEALGAAISACVLVGDGQPIDAQAVFAVLPSWREAKAAMALAGERTRLAARRYQAETAGIVWDNWPVATDRDSQAKVSAAYVLARDGHWPTGTGWKFADGVWRQLTAEQVVAMALAVAAHVQSCFAVEAAKQADGTDIEAGWPASPA